MGRNKKDDVSVWLRADYPCRNCTRPREEQPSGQVICSGYNHCADYRAWLRSHPVKYEELREVTDEQVDRFRERTYRKLIGERQRAKSSD